MTNLTEFINLYSLQKTLRFELKPVGKTIEHINNNELLQRDEHRAESYIKAKAIIDEYHKDFEYTGNAIKRKNKTWVSKEELKIEFGVY